MYLESVSSVQIKQLGTHVLQSLATKQLQGGSTMWCLLFGAFHTYCVAISEATGLSGHTSRVLMVGAAAIHRPIE